MRVSVGLLSSNIRLFCRAYRALLPCIPERVTEGKGHAGGIYIALAIQQTQDVLALRSLWWVSVLLQETASKGRPRVSHRLGGEAEVCSCQQVTFE